jgi:hypothetical protein
MYFEKLLKLLTGLFLSLWLGVGLMQTSFLNRSPFMTPGVRTLDKGVARQEIETQIAATPDYARYFARLRETFTADYETALEGFAARYAKTRERQSVDYYLAETMRQMRQTHGLLAAKADKDPLTKQFVSQLEVLRALGQEDKKTCVAFLYGATDLDFQNFAAARRVLVSDMALAGLEAMISGQQRQIEREKPSATDFRVLEVALSDHGLGRQEIDALLDGKIVEPPLDDARMCAAGQTYLEVLRTLPEAARMRIYALSVQLMAKS